MTEAPPSPAPLPNASPTVDEAQRAVRAVTRLSLSVAIILVVLKVFGWSASGSVSLLASLLDSGLDLIASLAVFLAVRWAAQPADDRHRYGYGKAEAFAGLLQAGLVVGSALFVGWEAVDRILTPRPVVNGAWGVGVMVVSMALTAGLVIAQTRALRLSRSLAVKGDRAHYSADLASNAVALIGVGSAAFLGAAPLDAAAGLAVAVWLLWGAASVLKEAAEHLLDRALPAEMQSEITALVLSDPRIKGVHQLRTRASGPIWMIQMHIDLEPRLTLEKAHAIVVEAEDRILAAYPHADILIHPDPKGRARAHGGAFGEPASEEPAG